MSASPPVQKRIPRSLLILIQRGKTGKDWLTIGNASFVTTPDFSQSPKVLRKPKKRAVGRPPFVSSLWEMAGTSTQKRTENRLVMGGT